MNGFGSALRRLFARDDPGVSVPAMDGVLKPNNRLEEATRLLALEDIDGLAADGAGLLAACGGDLLRIVPEGNAATATTISRFDAPVTFVAASDARIAVGLRGAGIALSEGGDWDIHALPSDLSACMTDADFLPDGRLAVTIGSRRHSDAEWKRDLMEKGRSGCVIAYDTDTRTSRVLAEGLAYPNGIAGVGDGRLAVSESWRHRTLAIAGEGGGGHQVLLDDLPAYPARLSAAAGGGLWMALFAPRRQLFEMVLREDDYRNEMIATIDPDAWIGPALGVSNAPDQPLQQGAVRQMGILKPWAPSSTYGLVVRCDAAGRPVASYHSRADGTMHGVTAVCETEDGVFAASRGAGMLLRLDAPTAAGRG